MPAIKPELLALLSRVSAILTQHNCQAYVVGGFVRDWLLGKETADIDLAVSVDAPRIAREVAEAFDAKYLLLDEDNRVARVVVTEGEQSRHLDFASFLSNIENDLARRDLTIDAMAVELRGLASGVPQVIDPFCGERDLEMGVVRAVSQRIFEEDAARLLRAVRLSAVETMASVEFVLREAQWKYGKSDLLAVSPWSEEMYQHFQEEVSSGSTRKLLLKLGGLLHDIAKPAAKTVDETGKMRFLGHAKQGMAIATAILGGLRFSSREIRLVEKLVYHHLRPAQMANDGLPTSRAIYRYFRDTEDAGIDILFLALADYLATHGPRLDIEEWQQHNHLISYILAEHFNQQAEILPVKLIDGNDLMDAFGLSPGPLIGELLTEVREAQAADELSTREEALGFVRKKLERRCCGVGS